MSEAKHTTVKFDKDGEFDRSTPEYLFKTTSGYVVGTFTSYEYTRLLGYAEEMECDIEDIRHEGLQVFLPEPLGAHNLDKSWLLGYCEIIEED